MDRRKRIAFYGGTFDPVHLGHLAVAEEVLRLFEIDELRFVPAQVAPHKVSRAVTPALHRYAMLALATQDNDRLLVSSFELDEPERSYTVDTLAHFKADLAETSITFFIMGADSWNEITSWRDWERLLAMTSHIVVTRPGYDLSGEPPTRRRRREGFRDRQYCRGREDFPYRRGNDGYFGHGYSPRGASGRRRATGPFGAGLGGQIHKEVRALSKYE